MSTLAFDIAQFFLSLNHYLLLSILNKTGFNFRITTFFSNYLIDKKKPRCLKQFHFFFFQNKYRCRSNIGPFFYFVYILYHPDLLLIVVSLFLKKKSMRNQTQICFVIIIILFSYCLNNSVL